MVSLTREGDREYIWRRARSQPRSATTAGFSPLPRVLGADSERGPPVQYEDTMEIRGATVMRQTDGAQHCRMGNQHRSIGPSPLQPGSNDPDQAGAHSIVPHWP